MLPLIHALEDRRLCSGIPSAANLVWEQQPSSTPAGDKIGPSIRIALEDTQGNLLVEDHAMVMLRLNVEGGGETTLVAEKPATHGIAVFENLRVNKAGSYQFDASVRNAGPVVSNGFTIMPGPAVRMHLDDWTFYSDWGNSFDLELLDRFGNVATEDTSTVSATGLGHISVDLGISFPYTPLPVVQGHLTSIVGESQQSELDLVPVIFVDSNPRIPPLRSPSFYKYFGSPMFP